MLQTSLLDCAYRLVVRRPRRNLVVRTILHYLRKGERMIRRFWVQPASLPTFLSSAVGPALAYLPRVHTPRRDRDNVFCTRHRALLQQNLAYQLDSDRHNDKTLV